MAQFKRIPKQDHGHIAANGSRRFEFGRDAFSFANELVWEYRFDPKTGATSTFRNPVPPQYAHRCFVLARSARQFLYHARFASNQPVATAQDYDALIRRVVSRSPRHPSAMQDKVVIPGYDGLRSFSRAQTAVLQAACGGAWQSYFLRSHWRMILPVSRSHQERMVAQIIQSFSARSAPILHIFRFPQLTINHGILLFNWSENRSEIRFQTYDPNLPDHPVDLVYNRAGRTFYFPRAHYWSGGRVDVVETYCGWLY